MKMKTLITLLVAFVLGLFTGITATIVGQCHYCPFIKSKINHKHQ